MTLFCIVLATMAGGLLAVPIAAMLTVSLLGKVVKSLVSLSAGVLLGTALLHVLPEAFESKAAPQGLFTALLEHAELYRHVHHHEGDGHDHHHHFDAQQAGRGGCSVLVNAGFSRREALLCNLISGLAPVVGGVLGYFLVGPWEALFPYLLVAASSSFIYVAVADLLPQLQQRLTWRETLAQVTWLGAGLAIVVFARALLEQGHAH